MSSLLANEFVPSDDHAAIREGVRSVVTRFGDDYWLGRDDDGVFPFEFHRAMADAGWLGITMPEEYGGAGLGVTEAAIMMHEVASHGGGMAAASAVHINLFGPHPIVVKGTPDQKARWVPRLVAGDDQCAFGFTEPDAGLNTTRIKTFAQKVSGGYVVQGQKVWTSTAQVANKIMLLTRTTRYEDCARPTDGITIFYTDLDRSKIEVRLIPKMGRKAVDSNAIFIDGLFIPDFGSDRRGGQGLLLHPAQPQSGAYPDRRRSGWNWSGCASPRDQIRARPRRVRSPDRAKSGHPAPLGGKMDVSRSGLANGDAGGVAVRP